MNLPLQQIRKLMVKEGFEVVLLRTRANFSWLTCGGSNHIEQFDEELSQVPCEMFTMNWTCNRDDAIFQQLDGKQVGTDVDISRPGFSNIADSLAALRRCLSDAQILQYKAVCLDAAEVVESVARSMQPGQSEYDIAGALSMEAIRRGLLPSVDMRQD